MATISAVIVPAKALKGGRHKIRVAVSHNGGVRYILTNIIIDSTDEFKAGRIVRRPDASYLNTKLRKILQHYQDTLDGLEYTEGLNVAEVVQLMKGVSEIRHKTIGDVSDEYMKLMVKCDGTRAAYTVRVNRIFRHIPRTTLMTAINHYTLAKFALWLREMKFSQMTQRITLVHVKTLINYAVKCGYANYSISPMRGIPIPDVTVRDTWLSPEELANIRDAELSTVTEMRARDLILLSYYLGGMNMADMLRLNFQKMGRRISYRRQKTASTSANSVPISFDIPDEAQEILDRLLGPDGRISVSDRERTSCCQDLLSRGSRAIQKKVGVRRLVFYSARKSFAQHAFALGVDTSTIDYILGHSLKPSVNVLYHYIAVTPEMATKAIRKVLDNLKNIGEISKNSAESK